jgi:DNA-binding beta-propeller fold protein YncE
MALARTLLMACACAAAALCPLGGSAAETTGYSITGRIAGSGGSWDYAVIDPGSGRFYLAQAGVTAVDLKTNAVTTGLVAAAVTHGVAPLGGGILAVDDSQSKTVTLFEGITGRIESTIPTSKFNPVSGHHALDALVLEPKTGLLVAVNGESGLLLLIDVKASRVAGTIPVGGHPEFAAADAEGRIYINVNRGESSEIDAVDIASRTVTRRIPLAGCEGATGLAYDRADQLVLSVCDNGLLKVVDPASARVLESIPVGRGADAVMFDLKRRRAFVAGGDAGTLSVIAVRSANDVALIQTLPTQIGTRLGAVDTESGRVYLPSAKFGPPKPPIPYPSVLPGSFAILVVSPAD